MVDEYLFLFSGTPEIVQVQCVNSESITITSHPEVFSRRSSETRNQSRNKKAIIIWVRASCTWEHQTHSDQRVLRLHSTLAQSWDCSLAWCCSKTHSTNCSSFGYSFDQSIDYAPFHHALSSGCCCGSCFRRPPGSFLSVFVERNLFLGKSWSGILDFPISSKTHRDELASDPTNCTLVSSDARADASPVSQRFLLGKTRFTGSSWEEGTVTHTLLRSATHHEVWEVFTLQLKTWVSQTVINIQMKYGKFSHST